MPLAAPVIKMVFLPFVVVIRMLAEVSGVNVALAHTMLATLMVVAEYNEVATNGAVALVNRV